MVNDVSGFLYWTLAAGVSGMDPGQVIFGQEVARAAAVGASIVDKELAVIKKSASVAALAAAPAVLTVWQEGNGGARCIKITSKKDRYKGAGDGRVHICKFTAGDGSPFCLKHCSKTLQMRGAYRMGAVAAAVAAAGVEFDANPMNPAPVVWREGDGGAQCSKRIWQGGRPGLCPTCEFTAMDGHPLCQRHRVMKAAVGRCRLAL